MSILIRSRQMVTTSSCAVSAWFAGPWFAVTGLSSHSDIATGGGTGRMGGLVRAARWGVWRAAHSLDAVRFAKVGQPMRTPHRASGWRNRQTR